MFAMTQPVVPLGASAAIFRDSTRTRLAHVAYHALRNDAPSVVRSPGALPITIAFFATVVVRAPLFHARSSPSIHGSGLPPPSSASCGGVRLCAALFAFTLSMPSLHA